MCQYLKCSVNPGTAVQDRQSSFTVGETKSQKLVKARAKSGTHTLGLQNLCLVPDSLLADRRMQPNPARQRVPELNFEGLRWKL